MVTLKGYSFPVVLRLSLAVFVNLLSPISENNNCSHAAAPTPPESLHLFLHGPSPCLFWSSPPPVSGSGPAHGYSWNRCRWHYVNMANPPPSSFFTSNEMGSTPVRSWSSALVILFGQKMCRILLKNLRHLFWNTSSMWHIPLVTFKDSAAWQCSVRCS